MGLSTADMSWLDTGSASHGLRWPWATLAIVCSGMAMVWAGQQVGGLAMGWARLPMRWVCHGLGWSCAGLPLGEQVLP